MPLAECPYISHCDKSSTGCISFCPYGQSEHLPNEVIIIKPEEYPHVTD
jgi:hypothetical protein